MRKRHENHVRKRVLLNGGDRTVVEQETPEKALAGLDARKPIGYRAVAVSFTLLTRLIMPIFVTIGEQGVVLRVFSVPSLPFWISRSLPFSRWLSKGFSNDNRSWKKKETVARKCAFAHYRDSVAIISLFFGTFECWQSSLQLVWSERCSTKYRERRIAFWSNIEYLRQPCVS